MVGCNNLCHQLLHFHLDLFVYTQHFSLTLPLSTTGIKYIFGTGFDETHKQIEEADLHHEHYGPDSGHDVADRAHGKTREQIMHEKRIGQLDLSQGPKPFGWFEEHPLDGGCVPPKVVRVEPFFIDEAPVTNKEYGKFVRATYYETEAEKFGWSFVLSSFLPNVDQLETAEVDPEAVSAPLYHFCDK
jgi:formylglycine-generating enzyme required for sulfatase activity